MSRLARSTRSTNSWKTYKAVHALEQLNSGAKGLALRTEQLEPGESVVGFTIPEKPLTKNLIAFRRRSFSSAAWSPWLLKSLKVHQGPG